MANKFSIYDTKAHLSKLLKTVKRGKEIVITERGKPIAKIIPYEEETFDERIERMTKQGLIRPGNPKIKLRPIAHRPGALKRFLKDR